MLSTETFHDMVAAKQPNICQITVLKAGDMILDDCWNGYGPNDTVHTMSVTKSVVSLLMGIALAQGLLGSVDDSVLQYFPDYTVKRGEKTLQQVRIRHLLTMTAPYKYRAEPWSKICVQDDWAVAALDYLGGRNGLTGQFCYSTLGIHILTGILAKQSGLTTVDYANRFLFEPLGIAPRHSYVAPDAQAHKAFTIQRAPKGEIWFSDPTGVGAAGYGLCLSAREMASIGQMCLQDGSYKGRVVVPKSWLQESTVAYSCADNRFRQMQYGYLWWIIDAQKGVYAAIGNSGNVIYVNPERALVVAVSGYFKPTVIDRIDFIRQEIEGKL